jgi:hypothetical protein
MIGFSLNPSPPMAVETLAGKFGGFLQVVADDSRVMISQVLMLGLFPPQMRTLEKPLKKEKTYLSFKL